MTEREGESFGRHSSRGLQAADGCYLARPPYHHAEEYSERSSVRAAGPGPVLTDPRRPSFGPACVAVLSGQSRSRDEGQGGGSTKLEAELKELMREQRWRDLPKIPPGSRQKHRNGLRRHRQPVLSELKASRQQQDAGGSNCAEGKKYRDLHAARRLSADARSAMLGDKRATVPYASVEALRAGCHPADRMHVHRDRG